jgi:CheY-like chemotaxis protein
LGSKRVGEEIEIAVRDTGIGIAADQIERIFDEFYQVDQGTQRPDGLGLGLSIVRRLASLLESRIQVQSQPGTGTTFSLRLPRAALARIEPRPAPGASTPAGGNVLVVDDEPAVAHATTLLLELEGFVVRTASCAREAIEQAATSLPDLIISDYHLRGGETGVEVVKALRARFGTTIPAVFVTGDTGKAAFTEPKLQKSSVLSKPLRADELLTVIRNQIGTPS